MMTKYQLLDKVGSGNFSTVHLVKKIETGQIAAIKIMKTHQNIAIREAQFLKHFDHPNIVKLLDFQINPTKGQSKIIIQYLPENTLQLYEDQQFGLRQQQVKCILFQAALGLAYIHEKGIIHRDIKPENILIDKRKAEIKLIDFGLAVSTDKINTDYVATRWYRAPQNLLGTKEYSSVIDVFSLGCVIVEMYLGNPLFPGTDNIDQIHRIFNILGQPTEISWRYGLHQYERMGLKMDRNKIDTNNKLRNHEGFGLRNLLNACSPALLALLQRMLRLNPKQRITSKDILLDAYFKDIKTIIPPHIYKRFEKDHLLKKTINKDMIGNPQHFITSARNRVLKNTVKTQPVQIVNPIIIPSKIETNSNHCALINFSMTPRVKINNEEQKYTDYTLKNNASQSSHLQNIKFNQNKKEQSQKHIQKCLSFRGIHPIKNNKVSMKDVLKNHEINSIQKGSQKDSRNNSIDSIDKIIPIKNNPNNKNMNTYLAPPSFLAQRKTSNDLGNNCRSPQTQKAKSIQRGPPLYSFKGQLSKSSRYILPSHMINQHSKHPYPPPELKLDFKTTYNDSNNIPPNNQTIKIKNNNLTVNSLTNRMNPSQIPLNLPLKQKQKISRSPSGNCMDQVQNMLSSGHANRDNFDKNYKQSASRQQINNQGVEKFKLPSPQNNQQLKTGRRYMPNPLTTSSSDIKLKSGNITHPDQKNIQYRNKLNLGSNHIQLNTIDVSSQSNHFKLRHDPLQMSKKWNSPQNKVKGFRSLEHREKTEIPKLSLNTQLIDKDRTFLEERMKMKTFLPNKTNFGYPKTMTNRNNNFSTLTGNNQQSLHSLRRQGNRNININLNVNIIQNKNKPQLKALMDRGHHF